MSEKEKKPEKKEVVDYPDSEGPPLPPDGGLGLGGVVFALLYDKRHRRRCLLHVCRPSTSSSWITSRRIKAKQRGWVPWSLEVYLMMG